MRKGGSAALASAGRSGVGRAESRFDTTRRLRRQRLMERIHLLGARAVLELLKEFDHYHTLGPDLTPSLKDTQLRTRRRSPSLGAIDFRRSRRRA